MSQIKLGRILPQARGLYDGAQEYAQMDIVMSADGSRAYMARQDVPAGIPLSNGEYWRVYADLSAVSETLNDRIDQVSVSLTAPYSTSGNPVSCNPLGGIEFEGLRSVMEAGQKGAGVPSAQNLRPVTGYAGVNLEHNEKQYRREFGETIGGGVFDWQSGQLSVEREYRRLDGSEEGWKRIAVGGKYRFSLTLEGAMGCESGVPEGLACNRLPAVSWSNMISCIEGISINGDTPPVLGLYAEAFSGMELEEFKSALAAQPIELIYLPAVPRQLSLAAQRVMTLAGTNTLSTDAARVELDCRIVPEGGGLVASVNGQIGVVELGYDDLKTRPFGEELITDYVIGETVLDVENGALITQQPAGKLIVGESYTVNWNGVEYACIACEMEMDGSLMVYLGDLSQLGVEGGNGEPFGIAFVPDELIESAGAYALVAPNDGSASPVLSVYGPYRVCTKIDEKFLPEMPAALPNPGLLMFSGSVNGSYDGSQDTTVTIPSYLPNPRMLIFRGAASASYNGSASVTIDLPTALPNPNALRFTGAVEGSYDGSAALEIEIPQVEAGVPEYWQTHLDAQADEICRLMEAAGRNKSSFFWYSDAHWSWNSGMSPEILKYLSDRTPINRTNFGGDVVNDEAQELTDRETMAYLWDWRRRVRKLPNHHSVIGNHDDGSTINNLFPPEYIYAWLMAGEEAQDIVRGGDFYYYIDDRSERTRYLYLDTAYNYPIYDQAQMDFICEALLSAPEGWHIVPIAHIWLDVDYDVSPPAVTGISECGSALMDMFDAYNLRSGEYAQGKATVEFCIGGHSHVDCDWTSVAGIPVILTETDSYAVRSGLEAQAGTTGESSVSAIIANYSEKKVHVVRIGRGTSRVVGINHAQPKSYTNRLTIAIDADGSVYNGVGYKTDTRLSSSGPADAQGWCLSGYIPAAVGDVLRLKNVTWQEYSGTDTDRGGIYYFDSEFTRLNVSGTTDAIADADMETATDANGNIVQLTLPSWAGSSVAYVRICCQELGADSVITVNEEIA